jgi:hypothetical protein
MGIPPLVPGPARLDSFAPDSIRCYADHDIAVSFNIPAACGLHFWPPLLVSYPPRRDRIYLLPDFWPASSAGRERKAGQSIPADRQECIMKVLIFAAVFWVTGFLFASHQVVAATTWPSGSYYESCNGCSVPDNSTVITCSCRRANGMTTGRTSINFRTCIGQSLINNNGTLQCTR